MRFCSFVSSLLAPAVAVLAETPVTLVNVPHLGLVNGTTYQDWSIDSYRRFCTGGKSVPSYCGANPPPTGPGGNADNIALFLSVPYAEPPGRWQQSRMKEPWTGTIQATQVGNACIVMANAVAFAGNNDLSAGIASNRKEDCLYLNIATPKSALPQNSKKLPVIFWIHGGGFSSGSGYEDGNPAEMVNASDMGAVVVTINYRLHVLGFLASEDIKSEDGSVGNFGVQDQRLALKWTKQFIGAFGGDPDDITIWGQSAGAASVWFHLISEPSFGLYRKAIIESGAGFTVTTLEQAEENYQTLLHLSNCSDKACLLEKSPLELLEACTGDGSFFNSGGAFQAVIDNVNLKGTPGEHVAWAAEHPTMNYFNPVPIIIGSVADEVALSLTTFGPGFAPRFYPSPNDGTFGYDWGEWLDWARNSTSATLGIWPAKAELNKMCKLYGGTGGCGQYNCTGPQCYEYPAVLGGYSWDFWQATRMMGDQVALSHGACSVRWLARLFEQAGSPAVYTYNFQRQTHPPFAYHTDDIPFAFGISQGSFNLGGGVDTSTSPPFEGGIPAPLTLIADNDAEQFAKRMSAYWIAFAQTDVPKPLTYGLPEWPAFTKDGDKMLAFGTGGGGEGIEVVTGFRKHACDYWEDLYNQNPNKAAYIAHIAKGPDFMKHISGPISTKGAYGEVVLKKLCDTPPYNAYPVPANACSVMTYWI